MLKAPVCRGPSRQLAIEASAAFGDLVNPGALCPPGTAGGSLRGAWLLAPVRLAAAGWRLRR